MRSKEVHVGIKHESIFFVVVFPFCFLLNDFQLLFIFIPCGETDLDKPLIKGIPRYNECIPRRTYSDMFRITNPCHKHIFQAFPRYSVYLDSNARMIPIADGIMLRLK